MMKLTLVTLMALLVPMLWVIGAKAQPASGSSSAYRKYSSESLTAGQRQNIKSRDEINSRMTQIIDSFRMMDPNSSHYATVRGLVIAAEHLQSYSNGTSDYFLVENYTQQIRDLQAALQVMIRLR